MPITAQYDRQADALYVRLNDGVRERAVEIDESTYVDVDADGRPIGIEILYPSMGLSFAGALERFHLQQQEPAILAAIAATGAPVAVPTYTGGNRMATATFTRVAVEGTVAASYEVVPATGTAKVDPLIRVPA